MNEEDSILIKKYLAGDEAAFAILVKKHIDHVYAFSLRMTHDPHVAEDITQQTFVNAWKHLRTFDPSKRFITWLLAITRNATIDHARKKKSLPFSLFTNTTKGNALVDTLADPEPLPDELFARKEFGAELDQALRMLPPHDREVLLLHYVHELTFKEIEGIMHTSRDTLKSQHRRALLKLRVFLTNPMPLSAPKETGESYK